VKKATAPSVTSLASGLATSRRLAGDNVAQRSQSPASTNPLPLGKRQDQPSSKSGTTMLANPLTKQELHGIADRLALEKLDNLHRQNALDNGRQASSRRASEEKAGTPGLAQKDLSQRTQYTGEECLVKSRTWPKNIGSPVLDNGKQLPRVRMVNGRWVEESIIFGDD
jgi:hypothetical protein